MKEKIQPELFDIEACFEENKKLRLLKLEQLRQDYYKTVDLPYFDAPKDDNEKLLSYQFLYLKNGDENARNQLHLLAYKILQRILWKEMKTGGYKWLDEEKQMEILQDAFLYIFRRYDKDKGYVVKKNYISVLKGGIKHALTYTTMQSKEISLDGVKNITWKSRGIYS